MKLAVIPIFGNSPYDLEQYGGLSDYHMALTHLVLKHPEYARYYSHRSYMGDYVILDNSIIELGEAMDFNDVLSAANIVRADEIVLPDVMMKGYETLNSTLSTLNQFESRLRRFKKMAVVHGATQQDFLSTFSELARTPEIDTLGIPKASAKLFGSRYKALEALYACYGSRLGDMLYNKKLHLLGAHCKEDFQVPPLMRDFVRGLDTVYPVWMAYHDICLNNHNETPRPSGKVVHEEIALKDYQRYPALANVAICMGWLNGVKPYTEM